LADDETAAEPADLAAGDVGPGEVAADDEPSDALWPPEVWPPAVWPPAFWPVPLPRSRPVSTTATRTTATATTAAASHGPTPRERPSPRVGRPAAKSAGSAAVSSSAKVPGDWVSYADPATGFTIAHPPDWELVVSDSLTDFRDPSSGAYLRVDHVQPPGPSPEGAWLEFEPRFAADHEGYQRIRIQPATYAGFPAAIWEYTYGGGGARLRAVDLGFVTGSYGFALNFQTREADWDRLQPVFDAFRASFKAPAA
jgi:hypothetical protein